MSKFAKMRMKKIMKNCLVGMLALCMVYTFFPIMSAYAQESGGTTLLQNLQMQYSQKSGDTQEVGEFTVTGDASNYTFSGTSGTDGVLTITGSGTLAIANTDPNTSTKDRIVVQNGVESNITLKGVNIVLSEDDMSPIHVSSTASANIVLDQSKTNTLQAGTNAAALHVPENASVTLRSVNNEFIGELSAAGGNGGAGIGANKGEVGGTITIEGGIVYAIGGSGAMGIEGTFTTSPNGTANIETNGISDTTSKDTWSGVIMNGAEGYVLGHQSLWMNLTIEVGETLTIESGNSLIVRSVLNQSLWIKGTLQNDGNLVKQGTIVGTVTGNEISFSAGGLTVAGGEEDLDYSYDSSQDTLNILTAEPLTIQNLYPTSTTKTRIIVGSGVTANITLAGVNIAVTSYDNNPIKVSGTANITLANGTVNNLKSGEDTAALNVDGNNDVGGKGNVTIKGTGTLNATAGTDGAGIGSDSVESFGTINIESGTINATGGWRGAGIGSGGPSTINTGAGTGTINISGGTVTATAGAEANSIGAGKFGDGVTINISGGIVNATGDQAARSIGSNVDSSGWGGKDTIINISGGTVTAKAGIYVGDGGTFSTTGAGGVLGSAFIDTNFISDSDDRSDWSGVIFEGNEGRTYGNPTLKNDAVIETGKTLTIWRDTILTIEEDVTLENKGRILVRGEIIGNITGNQPELFDSYGDFVLVGGTIGVDYTFADNTLTILKDTEIRIQNKDPKVATTDKIVVASGVNANLIFQDVNIDVSGISNASAFELQGIASATITLNEDTVNTFKSSPQKAGIQVQTGATLTIKGTGTLNATGGLGGAGIGSSLGTDGGTITIQDGTINATGGAGGGGIGGGSGGDGGTITIQDGTINATGSAGGAGIGGGLGGAGGEITLGHHEKHKPDIIATGGADAAGIGGGSGGDGGSIFIAGYSTIIANGGASGAGIGGGKNGNGGEITLGYNVYDGYYTTAIPDITATGGADAAGIGGGAGGDGGIIKSFNGSATATGGVGGAGIGGGNGGSGGTLELGASTNATGGAGGAGIGGGAGGAGGDIDIVDDNITATGDAGGAGIGGGSGGAGGDIFIKGRTLVRATGDAGGASIGGGSGGDSGTFLVEGSSTLIYANSISDMSRESEWNGIVYIGSEGTVYGDSRINNHTIEEGQTLTVKKDAYLIVDGNITVKGTFNNEGKILLIAPGYIVAHGAGKITGNSFGVSALELNIFGGKQGVDFEISEQSDIIIKTDTPITIQNKNSWGAVNGIIIVDTPAGVTANITLDGVDIDHTNRGNDKLPGAGILLNDGASANVFLAEGSVNTLTTADLSGSTGTSPAIHVPEGTTLTIDGKGELTATSGQTAAGIGSSNDGKGLGTINIKGGTVNATGGHYASGIGNVVNATGGTINISGGTVNAISKGRCAGIGTEGGIINISGGTVNATGGNGAAGIGSGYDYYGNIIGSEITISGGTITATGGKTDWGTDATGAGIGSGQNCDNNIITITGGIVNAIGGTNNGTYVDKVYGAGIGSGPNGDGGTIIISGGTVNATGYGEADGIGGGSGADGAAGNFSTAEGGNPGSAFIYSSSIGDKTNQSDWSGIIYEGNIGKVYKSPALNTDAEIKTGSTLTIESGNTLTVGKNVTLTIAAGASLTNDGTLQNHGEIVGSGTLAGEGVFKTSTLLDEYIKAIPDQKYTGAEIKPALLIEILGNPFELSADTDGESWTIGYEENINVGLADVNITKPGATAITKNFNIVMSDTDFDGGLKVSNGGTVTDTFTYGESITVKVTPKVANDTTKASRMQMFSIAAPNPNQMALFIGSTQITAAENVTIGNEVTFTIDTSNKQLAIGSNTITAKYVGSNNMSDHSESAKVTLKAKPLTWSADGTVNDKTYDGTVDAEVATEPTLVGALVSDKVEVQSGTVSFASAEVANGIAITVDDYSVGGIHAKYYIPPTKQPTFAAANITQAKKTGTAQELSVVEGNAKVYSFDLRSLLPNLSDGQSYGTISYVVESVVDNSGIFSVEPMTANILESKLPINIADAAVAGQSATVNIKITTDNYEFADPVVLTVKTISKTPIEINAVMANAKYDGDEHAYRGAPTFVNMVDSLTVTGISVKREYEGRGDTSYTRTETAPTNAGTYNLILTVTGDSANTYAGTRTVGFEIEKANATVIADDVQAFINTKKPDFTFTPNGFIPGETISGVTFMENPAVSMNTAGEYTITPSGGTVTGGDIGNYNITYKAGTLYVTADTTALQTIIDAAKAAKKGIIVNDGKPSSVASGTKFVSKDAMTTFNNAIATAENTAKTATTNTEVTEAIAALEIAKTEFMNAIQTGTYKPSGNDDDSETTTKPEEENTWESGYNDSGTTKSADVKDSEISDDNNSEATTKPGEKDPEKNDGLSLADSWQYIAVIVVAMLVAAGAVIYFKKR